MTRPLLRRLAVLAAAFPALCVAQSPPDACTAFLGEWSGTWSQGYYGRQRIHVTHVTDQCLATLAYSPLDEPPTRAYQVSIRDGAIMFACNAPGGTCHLEVVDGVLRFTYRDPSGFVNIGTFRKDR